MSRMIPAVLTLLFTTSLFAHADLAVTLDAPERVLPNTTFTFGGTVENRGPDPAANVKLWLTPCHNPRSLGTLHPGEKHSYTCQASIDTAQRYYQFWAQISVHTDTIEYDRSNNSANRMVTAITPPDLFAFTNSNPAAAPGLPFSFDIIYGNRAYMDASGVMITINAPSRVIEVPDFCTVEGNRAVCAIGAIPARKWEDSSYPKSFTVRLAAPDESALLFDVPFVIAGNEDDAFADDNRYASNVRTYRTYFVTNTADEGGGSLRAAIETSNAHCSDDTYPCMIAFRIPPTAAAWHTIALRSPLPAVRARQILIDGASQREYYADTNVAGPEIEISGAELREGNGIEVVTACPSVVRGLTINGFPGSGLVLGSSLTSCGTLAWLRRTVEQNFIGTDATATRAIPNHRGIWVSSPAWMITNNVISGNERAGIFVESGANRIVRNTIGLNATHTAGLGNGASGIYVGAPASATHVGMNHIGFNRHFGVAIARDARYVSVEMNSIQANDQAAIDWGLDGQATVEPVPIPVITSVRFENGATIIEGTSTATGTFSPRIHLYANDAPDASGYGEGQYTLGTVTGYSFKFTYPGDLRGKWVTATATHMFYTGWARSPKTNDIQHDMHTTTSELSRAVEVK